MKLLDVVVGLTSLIFVSKLASAKPLTSDEISELLPTIVAIGDQTSQIFSAAGATTYTDRGRASFGSWRVQANKYCSQWPPAGGWSCYVVDYDDQSKVLIWIGLSGDRTINRAELKK
ncbi:MAG: hypothetical protein GKR97_09870 [Rhizobiaceae bacterium]|nr:hypothetical protein [Rhizobiaceae bacterium]